MCINQQPSVGVSEKNESKTRHDNVITNRIKCSSLARVYLLNFNIFIMLTVHGSNHGVGRLTHM
jgi:hypothetical protein